MIQSGLDAVDAGWGYNCMDAGGRAMQERLPSDSLTQQVQVQNPNYDDGAEALLAKIKAERKADKPQKKTKKVKPA